MFTSICEVQTSAFQLLGSMCKFNTGLQWYGQQFPCILCIASPTGLLSSCGLYNVHEKSLIEGESELNYQTHRGQTGKKDLISLHISTILTQKNDCKFCLSLWLLITVFTKKLHVNLLSLAFIIRKSKCPKNNVRHCYMRVNWLSYIINNVIR